MTIYRLFPLISRLDWMTGASVISKQSYDARIVGKNRIFINSVQNKLSLLKNSYW